MSTLAVASFTTQEFVDALINRFPERFTLRLNGDFTCTTVFAPLTGVLTLTFTEPMP